MPFQLDLERFWADHKFSPVLWIRLRFFRVSVGYRSGSYPWYLSIFGNYFFLNLIKKNVCFLKITKNQFIFCLFQVWALKYHGLKIMSCSRQILFKIILICSVCLCAGCCVEVREQRDEHPAVQLQPPPLLATQLHGRLYLVSAFCWRERWAHFYSDFFFKKKRVRYLFGGVHFFLYYFLSELWFFTVSFLKFILFIGKKF